MLVSDYKGPWAHFAKWDKPDREDKYCMTSHTCGIQKGKPVKNTVKWRLPGMEGWIRLKLFKGTNL